MTIQNSPRSPHCRQTGFTLLELLVALAIFGLLAVMAYGGLNNVMTVRKGVEQHADRLTHLQTAFLWLGRDIEQTVDRTVRDEYGEPLRALYGVEEGNIRLELTHAGWRNPAGRARSNLQRVAYGLRDGALVRYYWQVLDRAQDAQALETVLLDGVNKLEIRYLDADQQWHTVWPATALGGEVFAGQPIGVEVTLETDQEGSITRLFRVPGTV